MVNLLSPPLQVCKKWNELHKTDNLWHGFCDHFPVFLLPSNKLGKDRIMEIGTQLNHFDSLITFTLIIPSNSKR